MGVRQIWGRYKVMLVMVPTLVLIHWSCAYLRENPPVPRIQDVQVPEPAIVAYVSQPPVAKTK